MMSYHGRIQCMVNCMTIPWQELGADVRFEASGLIPSSLTDQFSAAVSDWLLINIYMDK